MDTDLIYQFRAVYESQVIARAAEQLALTPGALSRAIKRLEDQLQVSLFIKTGRNIIPTKEASLFYHSSTEIVESIERAKIFLKKSSPKHKELRVATFEIFSTHAMAWIVDRYKIDLPIFMLEATPGEIEKMILEGAVDFGITYIPELHPDLDHLKIGEMSLGVFYANRAESNELPFAVPVTNLGINIHQKNSLDGWPIDIHREEKYKFQMLETALNLASRGFCKVFCPHFLIRILNETLAEKFKLKEELTKQRFKSLKVYVVKRKDRPECEIFKKICKGLRNALL